MERRHQEEAAPGQLLNVAEGRVDEKCKSLDDERGINVGHELRAGVDNAMMAYSGTIHRMLGKLSNLL